MLLKGLSSVEKNVWPYFDWSTDFLGAIMIEHAHNSFPTWIIETSWIHSASNNENCALAPRKSRLLKRVYSWKKENSWGFFFTTSVGQKLLLIRTDKTDCIQHPMKPSLQGWKTRAHAVYPYGQLAGRKYDIVANWQRSIAIMDVKRPEGQVINSVGLMNERFISSLWVLCLYRTGNKAFEKMKSPPFRADMSTASDQRKTRVKGCTLRRQIMASVFPKSNPACWSNCRQAP